MASQLEKNHSQFSHRVSTAKYSREGRTPSLETSRQLEGVTMEELRMLEADEKAAENIESSWQVEETALGTVAAVEKR
eukprot:1879762-Prorocentrum_lima.AAC.1